MMDNDATLFLHTQKTVFHAYQSYFPFVVNEPRASTHPWERGNYDKLLKLVISSELQRFPVQLHLSTGSGLNSAEFFHVCRRKNKASVCSPMMKQQQGTVMGISGIENVLPYEVVSQILEAINAMPDVPHIRGEIVYWIPLLE